KEKQKRTQLNGTSILSSFTALGSGFRCENSDLPVRKFCPRATGGRSRTSGVFGGRCVSHQIGQFGWKLTAGISRGGQSSSNSRRETLYPAHSERCSGEAEGGIRARAAQAARRE